MIDVQDADESPAGPDQDRPEGAAGGEGSPEMVPSVLQSQLDLQPKHLQALGGAVPGGPPHPEEAQYRQFLRRGAAEGRLQCPGLQILCERPGLRGRACGKGELHGEGGRPRRDARCLAEELVVGRGVIVP